MSAHAKLAFVAEATRIAADMSSGARLCFSEPEFDHNDSTAWFPMPETGGWGLSIRGYQNGKDKGWSVCIGYHDITGEMVNRFSVLVAGFGVEDVAPKLIEQMRSHVLASLKRLEGDLI
ncbi:hypothetical protein [Tabrizicola soli]|uniref:Uncharacterized protein n=1 Tax=Tabrizicola soli TaxID=2185115 RepID=A0ABV7E2F6_9RHOB|nr:hypothetical protein [Tabrizicola soli]